MSEFRGVGFFHHIGNHHKITAFECFHHLRRIWHTHHRVGSHDPQRFDFTFAHRFKKIDRLQAGPVGHAGCRPEFLHGGAVIWIAKVHVRGQHVGHAAHFTAAHGIRLTSD